MLFNYFSIFGSDESDGTIWMVLENGIMIKQQNNIWVNLLWIKAVFSEENCNVSQTANWVGKHAYCSLLCHNDTSWNPSIISRESMHKHKKVKVIEI